MKTFQDLIKDCLESVDEVFPWTLTELLETDHPPLLLDIREPYEFDKLHIQGAVNVPRGILETASEYGYDETVPELVNARNKEIVVICRSGNRSVLAAYTMQILGFHHVKSLKTGVKGWNEFEQPLYNKNGELVDVDTADEILLPHLRDDQLPPKKQVA